MQGVYPNDASLLDSAGRLLILSLFLTLGIRNLTTWHAQDHIKRLGLNGCPMPRAAFWVATMLEFIGCALLLLNWHPAIGVLCLLIFTLLASGFMHRFWETTDLARRLPQQNGLCANLAVVGGLLLLLQNVR